MWVVFRCSGIHKGHCDVPDAGSGRQAFVVVGESARVHEGPAFTRSLDRAVIAEEPASTTLQSQHRLELDTRSFCLFYTFKSPIFIPWKVNLVRNFGD